MDATITLLTNIVNELQWQCGEHVSCLCLCELDWCSKRHLNKRYRNHSMCSGCLNVPDGPTVLTTSWWSAWTEAPPSWMHDKISSMLSYKREHDMCAHLWFGLYALLWKDCFTIDQIQASGTHAQRCFRLHQVKWMAEINFNQRSDSCFCTRSVERIYCSRSTPWAVVSILRIIPVSVWKSWVQHVLLEKISQMFI